MIELGDTVTDTENGQKLVVGKTITLEAVERLPDRFISAEAVAKKAAKEAAAAEKAEKNVAKKGEPVEDEEDEDEEEPKKEKKAKK